MKIFYLGILLGIQSFQLQAQTNSEIVSWQQSHPDVLFIEAADLERIVASGIETQGKIIVYSEEVSLADISAYELETKKLQAENESNISSNRKEDADQIKLWLSENKDLKILQHSYFDQLSEVQKTMYLENGALVLAEESISLKDITTYESTH